MKNTDDKNGRTMEVLRNTCLTVDLKGINDENRRVTILKSDNIE